MSDLDSVNNIMPNTPTPKKKTTISEAVRKGEAVADAVKEFTPPEIDALIDRGTSVARMIKLFKDLFGGLFGKKKK